MLKFEMPSAAEVEVEGGGGLELTVVTVVDEEKFIGSTKVRDQFTPIEGSINQSAGKL